MKNSKQNFPKTLQKQNPSFFYEKTVLPENTNIIAYNHDKNFDTFPLYMHTHDFYELNIIVKGHGIHYINNDHIEASVGDTFVIAPHTMHGYYDLGDLSIFHIILGNECFLEFKNELSKLDGFVSLFYIEPKLRSEKTNNVFFSMSKQHIKNVLPLLNELILYSKSNTKPLYYNIIKKHIVAELICKFCMWYTEKNMALKDEKKEDSYYSLIIISMEYINNHYNENISIDFLCKTSYLSRSSYLRYFKNLNNKTPHKYITELRISKAKNLLKNTDKTITEIAQETGFFDSSHFERIFKNEVGILPCNYKNAKHDTPRQ